jgi:hypothetical protein
VKGGDVRRQVLCGLDHHTDYVLAIESSNEFGHSPKTSAGFKTDQGIPSEPPEEVAVQAIPASQTIQLFW